MIWVLLPIPLAAIFLGTLCRIAFACLVYMIPFRRRRLVIELGAFREKERR